MSKNDPLAPPPAILVKLGSLAVHIEEFTSPNGHDVDLAAINTLLGDADLRKWLAQMSAMAFLPVKRPVEE